MNLRAYTTGKQYADTQECIIMKEKLFIFEKGGYKTFIAFHRPL